MSYKDPEFDFRRNPRAPWTGASQETGRPKKRIIIIAATVVGVILFIGMLWQVYRLGQMTGSEQTAPLIQASRQPTKIRPEQPGGMEIPHQESEVFDRMSGSQPLTVESLLAPTEEPINRSDTVSPEERQAAREDILNSQSRVVAEERPAIKENLLTEVEDTPSPAMQPPPEQSTPSKSETSSTAPAANNGETSEASSTQPEAVDVEDPDTTEEVAEDKPVSPPKPLEPVPHQEVAVVKNNPVPGTKPAAVKPKEEPVKKPTEKTKAKSSEKPATPKAMTTASSSSETATGGRIQIAALRSESEARAAVSKFQKQFPNELGPLRFWITKVEIKDKGTFYRIQAGPVAGEKAKSLCDTLKAKSVGCMPVK